MLAVRVPFSPSMNLDGSTPESSATGEVVPSTTAVPGSFSGAPSTTGVQAGSSARNDDGAIDVTIAADAMTATATLIPPSGNGLPLTAEYVSETLVRMGITYGVMWDTLTELLFQLNTERTIMRDIPVATGTVSQPEYPEHIVIEERFIPGFRPVTDDQLNIDWKAIKIGRASCRERV